MTTKTKLTILFIFIATFILYLLASPGKTPYDYFTRLSSSLLNGKYYLTDNPSWLSELIPLKDNRFTFVNPPMPSIVALPFVWILGNKFEQQYLAHILGAASVVLTYILAWRTTKNKKIAVWSSILLGFGSIFWYLSATGSVWFLGQVTSVFFLNLALVESFGKKRPLLISTFLAMAFFSRLQVIFVLPFFIYLLKDKVTKKNLFYFLIPLLGFTLSYSLYNFLRFGNTLENGYTLIPGILKEPWFTNGQFSLSYIPKHLKILFAQMPNTSDKWPFITPSWAGLAIWITSPAFIFSLLAPIKNAVVKMAWITILLIGLLNFSYGSTGFSQFGYRYAVDFYPFLIYLTIKGVHRMGGPKKIHWFLLIISILVNLWGVLWINKFGWVSF